MLIYTPYTLAYSHTMVAASLFFLSPHHTKQRCRGSRARHTGRDDRPSYRCESNTPSPPLESVNSGEESSRVTFKWAMDTSKCANCSSGIPVLPDSENDSSPRPCTCGDLHCKCKCDENRYCVEFFVRPDHAVSKHGLKIHHLTCIASNDCEAVQLHAF